PEPACRPGAATVISASGADHSAARHTHPALRPVVTWRGMRWPRDFADLWLVVREGFLDDGECREILEALSTSPAEQAEVVTVEGARSADEHARRAWDVALAVDLVDTLIARLESLRPSFEEAFGVPRGPCDGVAALRYPAGGFYGPHRDS